MVFLLSAGDSNVDGAIRVGRLNRYLSAGTSRTEL